jgi:LPXTG-motif cell wall-anchored protein
MYLRWSVVALMLCVCSAASAVTLEVQAGAGSINDGRGFRPFTGNTSVAPGVTVHATAGSAIYVVYDNGCRVRIAPGEFVQVRPTAPTCEPVSRPAQDFVPQTGPSPSIVLPIVALAGVVTGVIFFARNNKNNPPVSLSP